MGGNGWMEVEWGVLCRYLFIDLVTNLFIHLFIRSFIHIFIHSFRDDNLRNNTCIFLSRGTASDLFAIPSHTIPSSSANPNPTLPPHDPKNKRLNPFSPHLLQRDPPNNLIRHILHPAPRESIHNLIRLRIEPHVLVRLQQLDERLEPHVVDADGLGGVVRSVGVGGVEEVGWAADDEGVAAVGAFGD